MKDTCLNCGKEVEIGVIFVDENGSHAKCPDCGSSFDVDTEIIDKLKPLSKPYKFEHLGLNNIGLVGAPSTGKSAFAIEEMLHRANKEGLVVVNYTKELDNENERLNNKFMSYMCGLGRLIVPIGIERQKTVQDYLKENKINSFTALKKEWELINNKKSKLSSSMRKNIEIAYKTVTKE